MFYFTNQVEWLPHEDVSVHYRGITQQTCWAVRQMGASALVFMQFEMFFGRRTSWLSSKEVIAERLLRFRLCTKERKVSADCWINRMIIILSALKALDNFMGPRKCGDARVLLQAIILSYISHPNTSPYMAHFNYTTGLFNEVHHNPNILLWAHSLGIRTSSLHLLRTQSSSGSDEVRN